jgi:hypothetical protein
VGVQRFSEVPHQRLEETLSGVGGGPFQDPLEHGLLVQVIERQWAIARGAGGHRRAGARSARTCTVTPARKVANKIPFRTRRSGASGLAASGALGGSRVNDSVNVGIMRNRTVAE